MKIINEKTYWTKSFTWGLPMTLLGLIVAVVLLCCGHRPKRYLYGFYFRVGDNWGGLNLGPVSVISGRAGYYTLNHEFGHSIQNCQYGLLTPFIVSIPSVVRFWYREYLVSHKGMSESDLPDYDAIWFEGQATEWGDYYAKELSNK